MQIFNKRGNVAFITTSGTNLDTFFAGLVASRILLIVIMQRTNAAGSCDTTNLNDVF